MSHLRRGPGRDARLPEHRRGLARVRTPRATLADAPCTPAGRAGTRTHADGAWAPAVQLRLICGPLCRSTGTGRPTRPVYYAHVLRVCQSVLGHRTRSERTYELLWILFFCVNAAPIIPCDSHQCCQLLYMCIMTCTALRPVSSRNLPSGIPTYAATGDAITGGRVWFSGVVGVFV